MQKPPFPWLIILVVAGVLISGCSTAGPVASPALPDAAGAGTEAEAPQKTSAPAAGLTLEVEGVIPGGVLPVVHTCKGASESPGVSWDKIPEGTKSLVLILDDPDAPGGTFTHWILYNIPPEKGRVPPAQTFAKVLSNGAQQGDSSAGQRGYYPVCPPVGSTHRYIFHLYAVDMDIPQPAANRESIDWALEGHTIAKTEVTTTFSR